MGSPRKRSSRWSKVFANVRSQPASSTKRHGRRDSGTSTGPRRQTERFVMRSSRLWRPGEPEQMGARESYMVSAIIRSLVGITLLAIVLDPAAAQGQAIKVTLLGTGAPPPVM